MKLNLGAGTDIRNGFCNIDFRQIPGIDRVCDLTQPLPFPDNSIDFILAKDILEHFSFRMTETILADWNRVLIPKGRIEITVPNFDAHIEYYSQGIKDKRYSNGYDDAFEFLRANIFGGQDYDGNYHKTCFTRKNLYSVLEKTGFHVISIDAQARGLTAFAEKAVNNLDKSSTKLAQKL